MTLRQQSAALLALAAISLCGCQSSRTTLEVGDNDLETFVAYLSPATFKIESFTRPVSFSERGNANGLEIVASTLDAADDPVKVVGEFHLELYRLRTGGGDQRGAQLGHWEVETTSPEGFLGHWEKFGRFYRFIVKLETEDLRVGNYLLNAWINLPDGSRVFAEPYSFEHAGSPVPPVIADE